ncbi:AraC family transcriptional regulator [Silvibacterium bohemicum]|uniref:AraC family transcriptional regulator n=1 Tax=Silvibacterium bohemicum TaxID=1577686 RepID=A0A841JXJ4_9BACT|nr:AraC family transcriptional regulator [Silvibacterium bohemicum]MBB6144459.1 AraC family transcriptional regulator [Silvibacterium bohemicum]
MNDVLRLDRVIATPLVGVMSQTLSKQCLFKVIKAGTFDHGLKPDSMTRYQYGPGDLILARKGTEEWVHWISDSDMLMLELPDSAFRDVADSTGTSELEIQGTANLRDQRISALVEALEAEQVSGFPAGRIFLDGIGRALAATLMQTRGVLQRSLRSYTTALSTAQLRRVIEQIHVHIERDLTVAELAETAGLSAAYFSEAFRGATGYPPHQFVVRARVERAKELLRTTDWTIIEVAMACGFQSPQQLAKVFQRLLKATPTGYRREFAR